MIKIIFVDDEPHVLDGLRRSMRPMRDQWETRYALSGTHALDTLRLWPADVVVTDLRMPGMDGVHMLRAIKQLHPSMIRFVLSGDAEPSSLIQAAAAAHQYLSKPCDAGVLMRTIGRSRALRSMFSDGQVAVWAGSAEALPSLPEAFQRITACLQDNTAAVADVAEVVQGDLAVTTMLLKLANSAFFGSAQTIRTTARAVSFLGVDIVASLVLASGVFRTSSSATHNIEISTLWRHSLQTASAARVLALHEKWSSARADDAFMAGMLHDVGHLVMAAGTGAGTISLPRDADHAQVGAYLVGLWGFPDDLVEAIAFHHCPSQASTPDVSLAALLHAANLLTQAGGPRSGRSLADMDHGFFMRPGMLDRWRMWQACLSPASYSAGEVA